MQQIFQKPSTQLSYEMDSQIHTSHQQNQQRYLSYASDNIVSHSNDVVPDRRAAEIDMEISVTSSHAYEAVFLNLGHVLLI